MFVRGSLTFLIFKASEKALAIATGVDMQFPSPRPFEPRGVNGLGVSI